MITPEKLSIEGFPEDVQELIREAKRSQRIIDALPGFIFIFDKNLIIRDAIITPSAFLYHTREQLIGLDGHELYSPMVCDLFQENIDACLEDKKLRELVYPMEFPERSFYYQARLAPYDDDHVLFMINDITENVRHTKELQEAKRKAEEADRMKSLFLANMSHEIRTPLNAIVGFSEMLSYADCEEDKKEYLSIIQRNSSLLLQLINDILDLSRMEAGKTEVHLSPVSLTSLISDCAKIHQFKMNDGVELKVNPPIHDFTIHTDRNRLTQVLSNFMSNAIKNTAQGSITLGSKLDNEGVHIYVTDTGCGISEENIPRIFRRFEKLNDFVQGTGLGLPICDAIVKSLGGSISVDSKLGRGSTFTVTLPLVVCADLPKIACKQKKVLIVTSSEVDFLQVNNLLRKDYEVFWARDCAEAMDSWRCDRPHMVLAALKMKGQDVFRLISDIRRKSADVAVIAVAERGGYADQQHARQAGCDEVFVRPYSLDELKEKVDALLR